MTLPVGLAIGGILLVLFGYWVLGLLLIGAAIVVYVWR